MRAKGHRIGAFKAREGGERFALQKVGLGRSIVLLSVAITELRAQRLRSLLMVHEGLSVPFNRASNYLLSIHQTRESSC